jgi:hypothetical protein
LEIIISLDVRTGMVDVGAPLDVINRFGALSMIETAKHKINQYYDIHERRQLLLSPEEQARVMREQAQRVVGRT